jgi:glutaminase A-like protein/uncharacterized protein DUF5127/uncharacterized protein DUF4964
MRQLRNHWSAIFILLGTGITAAAWADAPASPLSAVEPIIKPPATPLVTCDPYFSIWSPAARLTDADTTHWTGKPHRLTGLASIDGKVYRLIGREPAELPALDQTNTSIRPTQTGFVFSGAGVEIGLTFTTPMLPEDIDILSRPITYLTYKVRSNDDQTHDVRLYFEACAELTVDKPEQAATGSVERVGELLALKMGSQEQAILGRKGDDLRIDWGYFYVAAPANSGTLFAIAAPDALRNDFISRKAGEHDEHVNASRADNLSAEVTFDLPHVGGDPATRWLVVAYDDLYSIEYMKHRLRPYWRRNGLDAAGLLTEASRDYRPLMERCAAFDGELTEDVTAAGGADYAAIAALAYRQCFAAGKFVADANGQPLQFCKENHSNGCISTSDVFYPMSPQFLLFGPSLAKSFVVPFMNYAASDRWKFPFAPHDLGTYPKANGQVYGGGERIEKDQMPVEESGNLLILMAAIAKLDGNADFAGRYWPQLEQWAAYLKQKGFDPENQLCTDDFAGHLAHNVNLSAKAICGLGAFAQLCDLRGDHQQADEYRKLSTEFSDRWVAEAADGDHYRLAFNKPGSWSQKYNLVWDRVLGLNLFPESVYRKEMDFYRRSQNRYGLPLDHRKTYTKLDWILWTATLTKNQDDFQTLVSPVVRFLNETSDHMPMTDWYETESGKRVGFTARPVVGGVFMRMLYNDDVWRKWSKRDRTAAGHYAKMPSPPKPRTIVASADTIPGKWRFTTDNPTGDWQTSDFDDSTWQQGTAGFGTRQTPGARVGTDWSSSDIWLRRTFDVSGPIDDRLHLHLHHDEDAEVYINGVLARKFGEYTTDYDEFPISASALAVIKPTGNVLAVHCHQTSGGQYVDVGIVNLETATK